MAWTTCGRASSAAGTSRDETAGSHRTMLRSFLCVTCVSVAAIITALWTLHTALPPQHKIWKRPNKNTNLTLVTAYFDIGPFQKGDARNHYYKPEYYRRWWRGFSKIRNPVIAFFDRPEHLHSFVTLRQGADLDEVTQAHLIQRSELWSFSILDEIAHIYKNESYPKHYPNTVFPYYTCAVHAKMELMLRVTSQNPFMTSHMAWSDIGIWRDVNVTHHPAFTVTVPRDLPQGHLAYNQMYPRRLRVRTWDIVRRNKVWVGTGFQLGRPRDLMTYAQDYLEHAARMLSQGVMNTDQQVLYSLFNTGHPRVKLKTYTPVPPYNPWFSLAMSLARPRLTFIARS